MRDHSDVSVTQGDQFGSVGIASLGFRYLLCLAQVVLGRSSERTTAEVPRLGDSDGKIYGGGKADWKINHVYQPVSSLGDCDTTIQRYKTEVIPSAEQSNFEIPRNKFLFLATTGLTIA